MDVSVTSAFCFLLLILPQISCQQACNPPPRGDDIYENNKVGDPVLTIPAAESVKVELDPNPNEYFTLEENVLKAAVVFDFEKQKSVSVGISCIPPEGQIERHNIVFIVRDVNDNPPVFEKSLYEESINELSPPNTVVGTFSAKDPDQNGLGKLYYKLTPDSEGFTVVTFGVSEARVVTTKTFDYDKDKFFLLELYVQDTEIGSTYSPSFNDTITINITIIDIDNRPPWFQPCTPFEITGMTGCVGEQSYTGSVYLNEQQTGAIELDPNPIRAIDGDSGLNERIVYSIISGNGDGVFEIDSSTGSLTMLKPVTTTGTVTLRVLANQEVNVHQFAVTTVSINVLTRSAHKPQFPMTLYEGIVTTMGTMAENKNDMGKLLRILATDEDYAPEGKNPNIIYSVIGNEFFSLNDGYLFMTKQLEDGIYDLVVEAVDSENKETASTRVSVEVKSGATTPSPGSTPSTGTTVSGATPSSDGPTPSTGTTVSGATPSSDGPTPSTGTTISGATPSSDGPTSSTGTTVSGATPPPPGSTPSTGTTISGATPPPPGPTPSTETTISGATPPSPGPTPSTGTTISGATPPSPGPTLSTGTTISGATPPSPGPTPSTGTTVSGATPSSHGPTPSTETTVSGATPSSSGPTLSTEPTASTSVPSVSTPVVTTTTGVTSGNITPSGNPTTIPGPTEDSRITTSGSDQNPGGSSSTPSPNPTGDGGVSTANTQPHTGGASGGFDSTDMAALGATLGVLLFLAIVIMALLFCRLRRENKDWKKIYESNIFRSSLGQNSGGAKDGVQYTNNAFDNDEDNDNRGSSSLVNGVVFSALQDAKDYSRYESIMEPKLPPQGDDSSQSGSEKEVKPILTKERRVEEGYKSVWFKEDIDPNAKEEVVIIPDSRENGSSDEDDSSSDKESGNESPRRTSRVMFSNLEDEDDGKVLSVNL